MQEFFMMFFLLFALIGTAFWVWMLIECATKEPDQGNTRLIWVLIILFANFLGAAIYYFVRRPQRWAEIHR
jgi:membrane-associated phospholipid phosphatase